MTRRDAIDRAHALLRRAEADNDDDDARAEFDRLLDAIEAFDAEQGIVETRMAPAPPVPASVPRGPSAIQLRALGDALAKWHGLERWSCFTAQAPLPPFSIRWIDPAAPEPGFPTDRAEAATFFFDDADPVLCLRLDSDPDVLHKTCLHELQHLADAPLFAAN
jgi:hypothetical protein